MEDIAFFDLEVTQQPRQRIGSLGAYYRGRTWLTFSVREFEDFTSPAAFLCGHNILAHDLPCLQQAGVSESFLRRRFIDTLYLSPLLFPNRPYHRLVKDYQLLSEHLNDPVEDAKLARDLLADCLGAYLSLPAALQELFRELLQDQACFSGFFSLFSATAPATTASAAATKYAAPATTAFAAVGEFAAPATTTTAAELAGFICNFFGERICRNAALADMVAEQPVELAYVLALLHAPDAGSVIPPWLLYRFPVLPRVLHQLRAVACSQPECGYCREHLSAEAGLRRWFGYEGFRRFSEQEEVPLQQLVAEAALQGESLVAIFPTGGGKSLTFQLPALLKGEANRGLTVVVSPLQALMKDQVDVLRNRFDITRAVAINGLLSPLERADAIRTVQEGGASLLYLSPESLRSNTVYRLLKGRHIERFVIDEAHCFSAWGQDFRVDYLYIGRFLKELAEAKRLQAPIPVSCFTATAKPEVVQDIQAYFREQTGLELQVYRTEAARKNLTYAATKAEGNKAKLQQLHELLQEVQEPAIVYVSRTRTAEQVAEALQKSGFKAAAYHGRMEADVKIQTQDSFMKGETDVIVATSAFGMGVDKENVKLVVHYDISDSLENYLQEAGRAGRKADLQARCHLLFDENDLNEHFALLNQTKLSKKEVGQIWKAIKEFKRQKFTKSALEIAKQAGWDTEVQNLETQVKAAIAALEDVGYLKRERNAPRIFAQSILVRNVEAANRIIRANPGRFPAEAEQQAIRVFQYLISRPDDTHVDSLSDHLGIEKEAVVKILLHFRELGLLGDTKDLTALINPAKSEKNSERCFRRNAHLEKALLDVLLPSAEAPAFRQLHLRDLNEELIAAGCQHSSIEAIQNMLRFWEHQHYIRKERKDAHTQLYRIMFREEREQLLPRVRERVHRAADVVRWLCAQNALQVTEKQKREEAALEFSMVELKQQVEQKNMLLPQAPLTDYENVLLYLHFIGSIKLEGGLFVLYNPMTIRRLEEDNRKQYTREDYAKLERHYEKKVEQIHIMGAYAKKQLRHHLEALAFVDDYFRMSYDDFVSRHFRNEKGRLKQPITNKKFREVFSELSEEQLAVVSDKKSQHILVSAGPGSGKTRVLVHKVAALLLLEDIKPDQFLMLTFSRPAATEFRTRLQRLIGNVAYHIDIHTYHGFAFQLLGRVGDLQRADNVLQQVTEGLQNESISADRIKCKSVLVVDEYQDVSRQEYDFLNAIIRLADDVRVLVVGDDDQNIYEFRGSSVKYMLKFEQERQATKYLFSRNYRACFNLVAFSNEFLQLFRSDRLKAGLPLMAHNQQHGQLHLTHYHPDAHLVMPLVQDLVERQLKGTIAVLTHTNEEALLVQSLLQQRQVPARLLASRESYPLRALLELKCFSWYLHANMSNELGYISEEAWEVCRQRLEQEFAQSTDLPLALEVVQAFEKTAGTRRFWSDWQAFLFEAREEDFVFPEEHRVLVSTMHKAKGKEFDHVFLLLQNYPLHSEAHKRVVYVALTRARQGLYLHTGQTCFNHLAAPALTKTTAAGLYPAPDALYLELELNEVVLSFYKNPVVCQRIRSIKAGAPLALLSFPEKGLQLPQGPRVVVFSTKFKEKLARLLKQGYTCHRAEAAHVVVWFCEDDGKNYRILLPRLYFTR